MADCQGGTDATMKIDMLGRALAHISIAAMAFTPVVIGEKFQIESNVLAETRSMRRKFRWRAGGLRSWTGSCPSSSISPLKEQSVSRSQVLRVSEPVREHAPEIYEWMVGRVGECVKAGWLIDA
jgi:hypothetical protein